MLQIKYDNLSSLVCTREQSVLMIGSLSVLFKIYYSIENEQLQTGAMWLAVPTVLSCLLENLDVPAVLKRKESSGLYYGCALLGAIFLEGAVILTNSGINPKMAINLFKNQMVFSLWLISFLCVSSLFRKHLSNLERHCQPIFCLFLTGISMHFLFNITINMSVVVYMFVCLVCIEIACLYAPNCFTYGELLLLVEIAMTLIMNFPLDSIVHEDILLIGNYVLFFVIIFLASLIPLVLIRKMSTYYFYSSGLLLLACLIIALFESSTENLLQWVVVFLCSNWPNRQLLLLVWLTEILICVFYITCWRPPTGTASTAERKFFHIFILITFFPGIQLDIPSLFLCSIGATCLLTLLEVMRALKIPPLATLLNDRFALFLGPQDSGCLILTPIYLLLGQSLPIWAACIQDTSLLTLSQSTIPISVYSGILSVGVGDTAASVIGSKYGKHKWLGSCKTIEGTIAAFLAMTVSAILITGPLISLWPTIVAIIAISLLEAFTCQIDNLILPVYMYLLLNAASV